MSPLNRLAHLLAALLSLGAAIALLLGVGLPNRGDYSVLPAVVGRHPAPQIGSLAPAFKLPTASARMLALEQARGSVTIINFWATWCQPCRREMRDLQRLYDSYPGRLRILAVNAGESVSAARQWIEQLDLSYDILLDPRGDVFKLYQIRGLPTTYVLDRDHRIQRLYYGPVRLGQLRQDLDHFGRKA